MKTVSTKKTAVNKPATSAKKPAEASARKPVTSARKPIAPADVHATLTDTLTFHFGDVGQGAQWVRLTVDGVESLLLDRSSVPPAFDPTQKVTVPA